MLKCARSFSSAIESLTSQRGHAAPESTSSTSPACPASPAFTKPSAASAGTSSAANIAPRSTGREIPPLFDRLPRRLSSAIGKSGLCPHCKHRTFLASPVRISPPHLAHPLRITIAASPHPPRWAQFVIKLAFIGEHSTLDSTNVSINYRESPAQTPSTRRHRRKLRPWPLWSVHSHLATTTRKPQQSVLPAPEKDGENFFSPGTTTLPKFLPSPSPHRQQNTCVTYTALYPLKVPNDAPIPVR